VPLCAMLKGMSEPLTCFTFEHLAQFPELIHGFSYRAGGVSQEECSSLNCGFTTYDKKEHVEENRRRLYTHFGVEEVATMHQIHSSAVQHVDQNNRSLPRRCDGMTSQERGLALFSLSADCQPALFYDPVHKVIANVHAGWRGQMAEIYTHCVHHMSHLYGTNPSDLFVGIGPSLGPDASEFTNYQQEIPEKYWEFQVKPTYFNLWEIARAQLRSSGVPDKQIEIAEICTYSHPESCFSHRRHPNTGRHASVILLKK